ncbi:VOC family protein [Psychromonas antarctica]|uniref:VOC family protein n=1 Tax=Psychromonas antarctica TaxID=67573 RepID=UPI001EE8E9D9|nr:VOC family protein [Psychromonas antarctica]MCG6201698.1 VOC family protein [Psychromonas antarctica]
MSAHEKINYLEFPSKNLIKTKSFFCSVFDWQFKDYGSEYSVFLGAGINGGFYLANLSSTAKNGSALAVIYSNNISQTAQKIKQAGGLIIKPTFSFPGGVRFHFSDPNGNEYAVWSEQE